MMNISMQKWEIPFKSQTKNVLKLIWTRFEDLRLTSEIASRRGLNLTAEWLLA